MVTARVTLTNATRHSVTIIPPQALQAKADSNLNFFLLMPGSERLLRRAPVVFPKNPPETPETLEPGESLTRQFAFTNLTEQRGGFHLQAHYQMSLMEDDEDARREMLISEPVAIEVEGERALRRDRNGLIVRDDAIRIARERVGGAIKEAWAFPRENEAGLFDWWVTLEKMPHEVGPGESRREAYYVSPYGGFVIENREAPVYSPEEGGAATKP